MSSKGRLSVQALSFVFCIVVGIVLSALGRFNPPVLSTTKLTTLLRHRQPEQVKSNIVCQRPAYVLRMISYDPFVAHLENFITPEEATYLKSLSEPTLYPSRVTNNTNGNSMLSTERTSSSAVFPHDDPVVQCVKQRASELQGHLAVRDIGMQATVYKLGQYYHEHHDCGGQERVASSGALFRASTIFGILEATCEGCGTNFPYIYVDRKAEDDAICDFIECDRRHLTTKAIPGSAVFWRNRLVDGSEDGRMIHEGLPVMNGTKYAINIWSHERPMEDEEDDDVLNEVVTVVDPVLD